MKKIVVLLSLLLFTVISVNAEVADINRKGSLRLATENNQEIKNLELKLFKVANAYVDNGYHFQYEEAFKSLNMDVNTIVEKPESYQLLLKDFVAKNNIQPISVKTAENGAISFNELDFGVYLIVQDKDNKGFEKLKPIIATVPLKENTIWKYDIDLSLKSEKIKVVPKPNINKLPQTSQNWWPVYILIIIGATLVGIGSIGKHYEKKAI